MILKPQKGPQEKFLSTAADICIYGGSAGSGKAQPITEPILTPSGFIPMGDIHVGDYVLSKNGIPVKVLQEHPQGTKDVYEITFIDGAKTKCTGSHLWYSKNSKDKSCKWKVRETEELKELIKKHNYLIPMCEPIEFSEQETKIKPYTLGVLLGDGCLTAPVISFSCPDMEIVERIKKDGYEVNTKYGNRNCPLNSIKNFSSYRKILRDIGLLVTSEKKFIPEEYKWNTIEVRKEILRGLFDTDGYADKNGHIEYTSVSEKLAKDIQWIIWSLGGKATVTKHKSKYKKNGIHIECKDHYDVYIVIKDNQDLLTLTKKKIRCIGKEYNGGHGTISRRIKSIELVGQEECKCITVEGDGLYITKDFIVTHNSYAELLTPLRYIDVKKFGAVIFRKNSNQIYTEGGLWQEAMNMYSGIPGAECHKGEGGWSFKDKDGNILSHISFRHIERDEEVHNYQGAQICCCEINTKILMGDGTYKKLIDINVGDEVATLQGKSKVTKVSEPYEKDCVVVSFDGKHKQIQSTDHRMYSYFGWVPSDSILGSNPVSEKICRIDDNGEQITYNHPYHFDVYYLSKRKVVFTELWTKHYGKALVKDITVECANHYITELGIINRNCIEYDELTHFSEYTFFYMLSRNRSVCGVKPFVRATCNPDSNSWVANFISWWIDQDTGYPIKERSGKLRWMLRDDNKIYWAETKKELIDQFNLTTEEDLARPKTVTFISASIYDNQELLRVNPQYLANLKALPEVEREQLLKGNWKIKPSAGLYFKRTQVGNFVNIIPANVSMWCRCWDLAATSEDEKGNPAYTAGVLMGKTKNGRYIVADVINKRMSAEEVRNTIRTTAQLDNAMYGQVRVRIPQDPGQAGKDQAQQYIKYMSGFDITAVTETGSKEARATPMAAQWQAGNFDIVVGDWNDNYLLQLENFPTGTFKDMVDASANAFAELELKSRFDITSLI